MEKLYCGFAQSDITPDPGTVYLDGYGVRVSPAEGVLDPLYVKVCAIKTETTVFVIASFDICGFNCELKERLRNIIGMFTGLEEKEFAICATHTHSGPACGVLVDLPINNLYWNRVGEIAAETINKALASVCSGNFRFAYGNELTLPYNRSGRVEIDRRVRVCGFFDEEENLRGVIANASCHAVCLKDLMISADFPAIMTKRGAEVYPDVPFLFLSGRGADVDPNFTSETRFEMYEKLGSEYPESVFAAIGKMKENGVVYGKPDSIYQSVYIPLEYPPEEKLWQEMEENQRAFAEAADAVQKRYAAVEMLWPKKALAGLKSGKEPGMWADLQVCSVGNEFIFVFVSFEMLTATGNAIEKILTDMGYESEKCFIIGYSNGTNGYLVLSDGSTQSGQHDYEMQHYELHVAPRWYGLPGEFHITAEKIVLETIDSMIAKCRGFEVSRVSENVPDKVVSNDL